MIKLLRGPLVRSFAFLASCAATACTAHHDAPPVSANSAGQNAAEAEVVPAFASYNDARAYARGGECENADMSRSSWIRGAEFCHRVAADRGFLIVTLEAREYIHADVPNTLWAAFREAPSPGAFYNAQLRRRYRLLLIGEH